MALPEASPVSSLGSEEEWSEDDDDMDDEELDATPKDDDSSRDDEVSDDEVDQMLDAQLDKKIKLSSKNSNGEYQAARVPQQTHTEKQKLVLKSKYGLPKATLQLQTYINTWLIM